MRIRWRFVIIILLLLSVVPVWGFYLPWLKTPALGSFYAGYSELGGYLGTTFMFRNFLPHTNLTLGFMRLQPNSKNGRVDLGLLGVQSNLNFLNGALKLHLFYSTYFKTNGLFGSGEFPFVRRF